MFHPTLSKSGRFWFAPIIWLCKYLGKHYPKLLIQIRYYVVFRKWPNLKNPRDLNEKILWAKLYSDTSKWTELADKYKVRQYVENLGLNSILVKLYGIWTKPEDVDFDNLPNSFILKANNGDGKGTYNIVRDKSMLTEMDKKKIRDLVSFWLNTKDVGVLSAEPQYKDIPPCVVVEELLPVENDSTMQTDYKIWCFNGKAYYVLVCNNRSIGSNSAHLLTYDLDWNPHVEFSVYTSDYLEGKPIPKPKNFERMIEIAEILSVGFPELRVDLYNINGNIYFGELTFTSHGGMMNYYTPEFLLELGNKFSINDFPVSKL